MNPSALASNRRTIQGKRLALQREPTESASIEWESNALLREPQVDNKKAREDAKRRSAEKKKRANEKIKSAKKRPAKRFGKYCKFQ